MTTTSSLLPTGGSYSAASVTSDANNLQKTYSQFLQMLTTQLKNQDPTAPMDSNQFTAQLVSFSQVEQQLKMNDNLTKLVQMSSTSQTTMALSFIGLNITTEDKNFNFNPATDNSITLGYKLDAASRDTKISIVDSTGQTVRNLSGELTAGQHTVSWDGKDSEGNTVPAGSYTVKVTGTSSTNAEFAASTYVPGRVTGIQSSDDGTIDLIVNGKAVPLWSVTAATI